MRQTKVAAILGLVGSALVARRNEAQEAPRVEPVVLRAEMPSCWSDCARGCIGVTQDRLIFMILYYEMLPLCTFCCEYYVLRIRSSQPAVEPSVSRVCRCPFFFLALTSLLPANPYFMLAARMSKIRATLINVPVSCVTAQRFASICCTTPGTCMSTLTQQRPTFDQYRQRHILRYQIESYEWHFHVVQAAYLRVEGWGSKGDEIRACYGDIGA